MKTYYASEKKNGVTKLVTFSKKHERDVFVYMRQYCRDVLTYKEAKKLK